jgi:Zn-dependent protease with chaperone function
VALVLIVIAVTATATLCGSVLFTLAMVAYAYFATRVRHEALLKRAQPIAPETAPGLSALVQECAARLQTESVQVFVAPAAVLNAYTFGLTAPKVVVLYAPVVQMMDADELRFIVGHELGHVRLGHTWLNSLLGGMAGIPGPMLAYVVLGLAFRWWNRACEFSADRAGLLACGNPHKAVSALVRLTTGTLGRSSEAIQRALQHIEAEDDNPANVLGEALSTHPMTARRVDELRRFAASAEYKRMQALIDQNLNSSRN